MTDSRNNFVVGVRFAPGGKIYHFDSGNIPDIKVADIVVVETSRGWQLGEVIQVIYDLNSLPKAKRKPVHRLANPRDLIMRQAMVRKEAEAVGECRKTFIEMGYAGVKVIAAEYSIDSTRLSILVSNDSEEKIDLRPLRQSAQKIFPAVQIEIRQIGPRDAAKLIGGLGACGLEKRCCSRFLTDFCSISIRMAKEQGISLTPTEITGICGRLRCCLIYEYDQYAEIRKQFPKKNKRVITPNGEGKVVDVLALKETILVDIPELGIREFLKDEISLVDEGNPSSKKQ